MLFLGFTKSLRFEWVAITCQVLSVWGNLTTYLCPLALLPVLLHCLPSGLPSKVFWALHPLCAVKSFSSFYIGQSVMNKLPTPLLSLRRSPKINSIWKWCHSLQVTKRSTQKLLWFLFCFVLCDARPSTGQKRAKYSSAQSMGIPLLLTC